MKEVYLSGVRGKGMVAFVDDEDYSVVSKYKWYLSGGGYAITNFWKGRKNHFHLTIHRLVSGLRPGVLCDHINQNKLDNRKINLRPCNASKNRMNTGVRADNTSGYKGIYWNTEARIWKAQVQVNGKRKCVGRFNSAKEAAAAYNESAKKYYGEFAYLN